MLDRAFASDMAADWNIVWWVGEDHLRRLAVHQVRIPAMVISRSRRW
jgi:hypothetical protein